MEIRACLSEAELRRAYEVLRVLRPEVEEGMYMRLVEAMVKEGYRVYVGEVEGKYVCYAGVVVKTNLYDRRHLWVDDLVTVTEARSKGYGLEMIGFLEGLGRELECERLCLSSGLQRLDAHRFYLEKAGFEQCSYQFRKML